jgi:hypothetical protein
MPHGWLEINIMKALILANLTQGFLFLSVLKQNLRTFPVHKLLLPVSRPALPFYLHIAPQWKG